MADISFLEFIVYGFIAYTSMLVLILTTLVEPPMAKAFSISRSIFLIPGMICAGILAQTGPNIIFESNTIISLNTTEVWTEANQIVLQNEVWALVHYMIFVVLLFYVIMQLLIMFTKTE